MPKPRFSSLREIRVCFMGEEKTGKGGTSMLARAMGGWGRGVGGGGCCEGWRQDLGRREGGGGGCERGGGGEGGQLSREQDVGTKKVQQAH